LPWIDSLILSIQRDNIRYPRSTPQKWKWRVALADEDVTLRAPSGGESPFRKFGMMGRRLKSAADAPL
jgi:hypothetical protein